MFASVSKGACDLDPNSRRSFDPHVVDLQPESPSGPMVPTPIARTRASVDDEIGEREPHFPPLGSGFEANHERNRISTAVEKNDTV